MKTVIITGVSRGIGKATAQKFLEENWRIIGTSTSSRAPIQHQNIQINKLDLSMAKDIENFAEIIGKGKVGIDILINNAAISLDAGDGSFKLDELRRTFEVNLFGTIDLTEKLIPFINAAGHIINVSSGAGSMTDFMGAYAPSYQISKASLNMYTKTLADRLKSRKIIVSSITPGWVRTDMGGESAPRDPKDAAEEIYALAISKVNSGFFWYQGKKKAW